MKYSLRFFTKKGIPYPLYMNNAVLGRRMKIKSPPFLSSLKMNKVSMSSILQEARTNTGIYLNTGEICRN